MKTTQTRQLTMVIGLAAIVIFSTHSQPCFAQKKGRVGRAKSRVSKKLKSAMKSLKSKFTRRNRPKPKDAPVAKTQPQPAARGGAPAKPKPITAATSGKSYMGKIPANLQRKPRVDPLAASRARFNSLLRQSPVPTSPARSPGQYQQQGNLAAVRAMAPQFASRSGAAKNSNAGPGTSGPPRVYPATGLRSADSSARARGVIPPPPKRK